jgi:hypothetical protein
MINNMNKFVLVTMAFVVVTAFGPMTSIAAVEDFSIPLPAPVQLNIPTYDGSGQAVHPDIAYFASASGWNGYKYWMVMTPYPKGNSAFENPSIIASNNGVSSWIVPSGLTNPIDPKPSAGSNSDVELVYNEELNRLEVYYVESGAGTSYLRRKTSINGKVWSSEQSVFNLPDYQIMSPAIIKSGSVYDMWYSDGASCSSGISVKYRSSTDGMKWSTAQAVNIHPSVNVWHVDVKYIPSKNEYWMIYAAYPKGSTCGNTDLYFAKSKDKINWLASGNKIISRASWYNAQVYRSTFLFDEAAGALRIWLSARDSVGNWHLGYTSTKVNSGPITPTPSPTLSPTPTPSPSPIPMTFMVGYWPFNEGVGNIAVDSSANKNNVNLINNPVWIDGKKGKALRFNGVNSYVTKKSTVGIPNKPPFTVEFWANAKNFSNPKWNDFFRKEGSWAVQATPGGKLSLEITGKQDIISSVSIPTNEWVHLAVTFEGTTVKYYKNGVLADTKTQINVPNTGTTVIAIGGGNYYGSMFNGILDEVKIFNKALNEGEIKEEYKK